jgi:hypothetical protein
MQTSRIWFTAAQKAELWERWKNGQSAAAISRALERKNKTGVERIVVLHGGIGPAPRRRALAALRFEEREEISRGVAVGRSIRQIHGARQRPPHHPLVRITSAALQFVLLDSLLGKGRGLLCRLSLVLRNAAWRGR